jgi:HlyD family secretion protein
VQVSRYELDAAEAVLGHSAARENGEGGETVMLRSPVTGNVLARLRESEGVVSAGTSLLELGDTRQLEVEVEVLSPDAVRIHPGGRVLFERWGGDEPLEGVVRTVEPRGFMKVSALGVEEQRVLVIADIASPPQEWQALGDGYRVEARFVVWESPDALVLPSSALFRRDGDWVVYRVEDGRARLTPVRIGHNNGLDAEVLDGLQAGDRVIVHPGDDVDDGARVEAYSQAED